MIYGHQFKNIDEEYLVLEIESNIFSILENVILLEDSITTKLTLKMGKKNVDLYIRNSEGGKGGAKLTHGPSLKISNKTLGMPSIIIPGKNQTAKIDPNVSNEVAKKINREYKDVIDFTNKNAEVLTKIYHCDNITDFNKYIDEIINAECNKDYKISKKKV